MKIKLSIVSDMCSLLLFLLLLLLNRGKLAGFPRFIKIMVFIKGWKSYLLLCRTRNLPCGSPQTRLEEVIPKDPTSFIDTFQFFLRPALKMVTGCFVFLVPFLHRIRDCIPFTWSKLWDLTVSLSPIVPDLGKSKIWRPWKMHSPSQF